MPGAARGDALVVDDDVRGQRGDAAGDGPGVEVVDVDDAGRPRGCARGPWSRSSPRGRRLEQHVDDRRAAATRRAAG